MGNLAWERNGYLVKAKRERAYSAKSFKIYKYLFTVEFGSFQLTQGKVMRGKRERQRRKE